MRIVFMGTPAAAVPSLQKCLDDGHEIVAVWTQPDKLAGRGQKSSVPPVKEFATTRGLSVHQPAKIKTAQALELFASHRADLAAVVAYGRILPSALPRTTSHGCINVHFSLLPLYRGAAPVNWAIVNGETRTGVTTMFIEERLDSGPILLQSETDISEEETATELMQRLSHMGADLLGETLKRLPMITPRPQHDRDATFAPMLRKEDGLIDWSASAFVIERCIRGFQPWPNAYTHYKSRRLIIWKASPRDMAEREAGFGGVISAQGDELIVNCGEQTSLRLLEVQPEATRRMSARDFLNGMHIRVGDQFGEH